MHWIDYECPRTLDEAVALFRQHGNNARALAGGTDLLVQMKTGGRTQGVVIDAEGANLTIHNPNAPEQPA